MKDSEYNKIVQLTYLGGGFIPCNEKAEELCEQSVRGEVISFIEVTTRDLKFHKCYMSLLSFIYGYMPSSFKRAIPKKHFYQWLKHLKGQYNVIFTFKDGTKMVEYESIAFGNMSQKRFQEYVKEQLPFIYENVIGACFKGNIYNSIIDTIELEYKKFFNKL